VHHHLSLLFKNSVGLAFWPVVWKHSRT